MNGIQAVPPHAAPHVKGEGAATGILSDSQHLQINNSQFYDASHYYYEHGKENTRKVIYDLYATILTASLSS